mgnify:CR=1 FL=1
MKYKLEPAIITTKKGDKIKGFRQVAIDTAKNLSYIEKRKKLAKD